MMPPFTEFSSGWNHLNHHIPGLHVRNSVRLILVKFKKILSSWMPCPSGNTCISTCHFTVALSRTCVFLHPQYHRGTSRNVTLIRQISGLF
jgi:hypothetical protein